MRENVSKKISEPHRGKKYVPNRVSFSRFIGIIREFRAGFKLLKKYDLAITFFGSSRESLPERMYLEAADLARRLSHDGFTIFTGGGHGIMEAANRGVDEIRGSSVGLNIKLPTEQQLNIYTTDSQEFEYFFIRKVMLSFASEAYIFFPGGFGTMDEFFEIITLIQTKKIQPIPVILVGKDYWTPLLKWIEESLYKENGTINEEDLQIYHLVDDAKEAHDLTIRLIQELCPDCNYNFSHKVSPE